jgi:surface protein
MLSLSRKPRTAKPCTDERTLLARLRGTRGAIDLASIMVGVLVIGIVGGVISATTFAVVPFAQDEAAKGGLAAVNTAQSAAFTLSNPNSYFAYDNHASSVYQAAEVGNPGLEQPSERLVVETSPSGQYWVGAIESDAGEVFYRASTNPEVYSIDPDDFLAAGSGSYLLLPDELVDALPAGMSSFTVDSVLRSVIQDAAYNFGSTQKAGFGDGVAGPPGVAASNRMVSTWDTSIAGCSTITMPLQGSVDATIDWGDGSAPVATTALASHTYTGAPGVKTVTVSGNFESFWGQGTTSVFNHSTKQWDTVAFTPQCITGVTAWGETGTTGLTWAFNSAINLTSVVEIPSTVTSTREMFNGATSFNGDVSGWDTSNITTMEGMFRGASAFNQPLNSWETGNVERMTFMFSNASAFNRPLDGWDTGKVEMMYGMFSGALAFNQDISNWSTGSLFSWGGGDFSTGSPLEDANIPPAILAVR